MRALAFFIWILPASAMASATDATTVHALATARIVGAVSVGNGQVRVINAEVPSLRFTIDPANGRALRLVEFQ